MTRRIAASNALICFSSSDDAGACGSIFARHSDSAA